MKGRRLSHAEHLRTRAVIARVAVLAMTHEHAAAELGLSLEAWRCRWTRFEDARERRTREALISRRLTDPIRHRLASIARADMRRQEFAEATAAIRSEWGWLKLVS